MLHASSPAVRSREDARVLRALAVAQLAAAGGVALAVRAWGWTGHGSVPADVIALALAGVGAAAVWDRRAWGAWLLGALNTMEMTWVHHGGVTGLPAITRLFVHLVLLQYSFFMVVSCDAFRSRDPAGFPRGTGTAVTKRS